MGNKFIFMLQHVRVKCLTLEENQDWGVIWINRLQICG